MVEGRSERIGVFGGTFDPPHVGHLTIACQVIGVLNLDRLLLVVAGDPWQKSAVRSVTPAEHRFAMVQAAVERHPAVEVSRIEIERDGPSYMVETLDALTAMHPEAEFFLIIGSDAVPGLSTWHDSTRLREQSTLVIVQRPDSQHTPPPEGWRHVMVDLGAEPVASSEVRQRVADGLSIVGMVPDAVIDTIASLGLYREGQ